MTRTMTVTLRITLDDLEEGERATYAAEMNLKPEDLPGVADLDLNETAWEIASRLDGEDFHHCLWDGSDQYAKISSAELVSCHADEPATTEVA